MFFIFLSAVNYCPSNFPYAYNSGNNCCNSNDNCVLGSSFSYSNNCCSTALLAGSASCSGCLDGKLSMLFQLQSELENRTCSVFGWSIVFGQKSQIFEIGTFPAQVISLKRKKLCLLKTTQANRHFSKSERKWPPLRFEIGTSKPSVIGCRSVYRVRSSSRDCICLSIFWTVF